VKPDFPEKIEKSVRDIVQGRKKAGFWHYAYLIGVGGWLLALPIVAGAYVGWYLDKKFPGGVSWTITLMLLGIAVGAYNVWYFLMRNAE
jgi:ATP synthase protein I